MLEARVIAAGQIDDLLTGLQVAIAAYNLAGQQALDSAAIDLDYIANSPGVHERFVGRLPLAGAIASVLASDRELDQLFDGPTPTSINVEAQTVLDDAYLTSLLP